MLPFRSLCRVSLALFLSLHGTAAGEAALPDGVCNVSLQSLGATAKGSGVAFNRDWPPNNTLQPDLGRGGTLFGSPMTGGRVDISLILPCDIVALEVVPLDYYGSRQPKSIDIFIDGKLAKQVELPETPGKLIRIPLQGRGQVVGILVTSEYPVRTLPDGKPGPAYGGWSRLRVQSTTKLAELMQPVDAYQVPIVPDHIAPTSGTVANGAIEVFGGQPRQTQGHPCTLWDQEDIAHYQGMLKTSTELQGQLAGMRTSLDQRITMPVGVPPPLKGADGKWRHIGDTEVLDGRTYGTIHTQLGLDVANLGTAYALTGEARYAEFAKKILLAYAEAYPNYAIGARPGFSHSPSRAFDQVLSDSIWIIQVARGYDLIHDLPTITADERKQIDEVFFGCVGQLIIGNHAVLESPTNWSAICTCALLTIGYATDNEGFVNTALYGIKGTQEKPTGGLIDRHFSPKAIDADGMWGEGAIHYQFMAMQALVMDAEILWHHGIDLYRHREGIFKRLFDSPLQFAYPDMTAPATNDTGHGSIIGHDAFLYEYAYRRYRDPSYLPLLNQCGLHLGANYQEFPVSILYDRDRQAKTEAVECKSVNFFGVGMGILRTTTEAGTSSLLLKTSPNRSHGHPDKLSVDFYAFNDQLSMDPGCVWYEQPIYRQWYRTTLAHNTLVVDELDQIMSDGQQLVYGPAGDMGIQRGRATAAYAGVIMDRSLFLTPEYCADLFGAFTRLPRKLDLAWHIRGEFASDLTFAEFNFPPPVENGYCALTNVRRATTDQAWGATLAREGNTARFLVAANGATEVIVGDGIYGMEKPPTIIQRRVAGSTVFANVIDTSNVKGGHVRKVQQEGGLEAGYTLLSVETVRGTDRCLATFRPGLVKAGGVETDALQAFVRMDGEQVRALYLGGGSTLKAAGISLARSTPGLAYLEKADNGAFVLANPSPTDAAITITAPLLAGMQAFALDVKGRRTSAATITSAAPGSMLVQLKAAGRIEFAPADIASVYDIRQGVLAKRQVEQEAQLAKARNECLERTKTREAEAQAKPVPANTVVVVPASSISSELGGKVRSSTTKRAIVGPAILGWDAIGHGIEWEFNVPAEGYYHLTLCYCSDQDQAERLIAVNGKVQEPFAPMVLLSTGGFANSSDDWRLYTAGNPANGKSLLLKLKQGKNLIRLTNSNGRSANVNYLAITSPDVRPTRDMLAGKMPATTPAP